MKVIIQSIWPELQETINSWVESILASVNQWNLGLGKELNTENK
jgi:hypothetical protein